MRGLASVLRTMARNPAATLSTAVVAGVWGAIAVNAVFLQAGPHPAPLLGIPQDTAMLAAPERLPPSRPEQTNTVTPSTWEEDTRREEFERELALVREVQRSLSERGFYDGPVDGLDGPRTAAAIRGYERAAGMEETGEASESLLTHIELSGFAAAPLPKPAPAGDAPAPPEQVSTIAALIEQTREVDPAPAGEQEAAIRSVPVDTVPIVPADPRIEAVQRVLADLGYAPGVIDGRLGPETRAAISRFEADRGLPATGDLSDRLIRELSAISGVTLG